MIEEIELMEPLITAAEIEQRVAELGEEINAGYADTGRPLSVVVVLKGACVFAIDLLRHLKMDTQLDFLRASSYAGTTTSGEVSLLADITMPIAGTDVLLVEDIVDTGLTAAWLRRHLESHEPASVRLAALLDKPSRRRINVQIDWVGFTIPDAFVLGYGLDFNERYRNLPAVYVARPVVTEDRK